MRRIAIAVGIVIALVLVLAAAALLLVDVNTYRGPIQVQLQQQLNREVTLGNMSLGLIPLRFQVENPVIAEDPDFGNQHPFIQAQSLDVRVRLLSLLSGNVQVHSLDLERPSVELVRNADGRWNFSTLGASEQTTSSGSDAAGGSGSAFTLDRLSISDGQVAVTDHQQNQPRTIYDHIDLSLEDYAADRPFSIDLAAHIPGEGAQEVRLQGEAGPLAGGNPSMTPFHGTMTLNAVGIEGLKQFLNSEMLANSAGSMSGSTEIANEGGNLTAAGNLTLDGARFNSLDVGYPIRLDYDVAANTTEELITINTATIGLGETPIAVAGTVDVSTTPARINLSLKSGEASIVEIARLASAFGVAFGPGTDVTGRVSMDVQASGSTERPALTGTIAGRGLRISGNGMPQPVEVQSLDLALTPAEIRSNEFTATSGKTTLTGRFGLRQYTSPSPVVDVALRAPNATLPEIQSIAKAYGITSLDQITGEGGLNLDLRASGPTQSLSSPDILRALNGTLNLDFSPLQVAGFDTARELGVIGGFASNLEDKKLTELLRLTGRVVIQNGVAQSDDLQAQTAIGNIAGTGTADLVTETLNLKLSAVLSKEFSDRVGGSKVGGYMNTALSNSAGELVIPAIVTGTFRQPKFAPDVRAIAQMQRQRLLPTFDNPRSAVSSLLGVLTQPKEESPAADQPAAQPSETRPADRLRGVLEGFLGGSKQQEQ